MSKYDFPAEEFAGRRARVRQAVADAGFDWMILVHPVSIHWLTGSDAKSYQAFQCLLISAEDKPTTMLTRESERCEFEQDALIDELVTWGGSEPEDPLAVFAALADRLGLWRSRVGLEMTPYYLHPFHYECIKTLLGTALVGESATLVHDLKLVKSPNELTLIRSAAEIADKAFDAFVEGLLEGRSELQVAGDVYRALLANGSGIPASTLNLVAGERSAFSHGAPTERRFQHGDFGNIEFGATCKRYTATIGRQFSLGKPTTRMREIYEVVKLAGEACIAEIRDGVPAIVPHEAARRVITEAGLDAYRIHTSGYGLAPGFPPSWGEPLNLFGGTTYTLREGMVVSVEPPVFIGEERLGIRIIDNVVVSATGATALSRRARDLIVLE